MKLHLIKYFLAALIGPVAFFLLLFLTGCPLKMSLTNAISMTIGMLVMLVTSLLVISKYERS